MIMDKNNFVRGRRRQRRKTPKAKTGCMTCKVRHVKCDETRPSCSKCTATGRKCDGYAPVTTVNLLAPVRSARPASPSSIDLPIRRPVRTIAVATSPDCLLDDPACGPSNRAISLSPFSPIPSSPIHGRAIHYFVHRSSLDLTGPLHSQVWRKYVLSVSASSPAIQHAITALSEFHEAFSFPRQNTSSEQCWREYYLAAKQTGDLVKAAEGKTDSAVTHEILVACAIFVTIEILIGNTEAALRHLEGGFALFRTLFTHLHSRYSKTTGIDQNDASAATDSLPAPPPFESHTLDLIGFFARVDLQLLSFMPRRHHAASEICPGRHPPMPQLLPIPIKMSAALYRVVKQSLYWMRHYVEPFKYSAALPKDLYDTQRSLLVALDAWRDTFLGKQEHLPSTEKDRKNPCPKVAHLLLTYHLTSLKLRTALSPSETKYESLECLRTFSNIVQLAFCVLRERTGRVKSLHVSEGKPQIESFFSLESSVVEALYYTAIKCRESTLRNCALMMLRTAGREGVWDGAVMGVVAEYVVALEEDKAPQSDGDAVDKNSTKGSKSEFLKMWVRVGELGERLAVGEMPREDDGVKVPQERMIQAVHVDVQRQQRKIDIECERFVAQGNSWQRMKQALQWPYPAND